jgi:hypothetical protein
MGSFFWSNKDIKIKRTKYCFMHYIRWLNFYFNRYKIYETNIVIKKIFNIADRIFFKFFDITNDEICEFEKEIIGGILWYNLNGKFDFREKYLKKFILEFSNNHLFKILTNIRGEANNHKIVIIFNEREVCLNFLDFMNKNKIKVLNGYELLTNDLNDLPNAKKIDKKVVELPIENNEERMEYLFYKIKEFINGN